MKISYYISKAIKKIHLPAIKQSCVHKKSKICSGAHIVRSSIGKYSYIGNFTSVIDCEVGNFCSIADNCVIGGMSHPLNWVTTSPVIYTGKNCLKTNFSNVYYNESSRTIIENDVWIGDNCNIKSGVHLSNGCVIGMGSVVTKDVGAYEIWAGNPARLIRKRFENENITFALQKLEWWNWEDEKIKKYAYLFQSPEKLIQELQDE